MINPTAATREHAASTPRDSPPLTPGHCLRGKTRGKRDRHGASAVEFALVAPIFFMLVIGMIEVGRALMVQQILTNASRVGARRAVTLSSTQQAALDVTTDYATNMGVPGVTAMISPDPGTAQAGDQITVNASVDFREVSWMPAPWFMKGTILKASSVMRKEGF